MKEVPGHVGWRGKVQLKCGNGRELLWGAHLVRRARTFQKGRALIAYLNGRGLKPLREVW